MHTTVLHVRFAGKRRFAILHCLRMMTSRWETPVASLSAKACPIAVLLAHLLAALSAVQIPPAMCQSPADMADVAWKARRKQKTTTQKVETRWTRTSRNSPIGVLQTDAGGTVALMQM